MEALEEITIENMLENIFTTYSAKKKRKDIVSFYCQKFNIGLFGEVEQSDGSLNEAEIIKRVETVLKEDKNSTDPYLKYSSPYYSKAKRKAGPIGNPGSPIDTNYIGKAGECVVMGELLFRGYNVNNMMVDEGIDLVASKNNVFYYIQVKTKNVEEQNRFYFQIKQDRFDTFVGTQIRYILVARCSLNNEDRNIFFMFTNGDIQRLMYKGVIPQPNGDGKNLSIKIEFDQRTGKAYMYDGRERDDVSFNMNNFNL